MITGTALFAGQDPLAIAMSHMEGDPAPLPDAAGEPLQALIARACRRTPPTTGERTEFAEEIAAARQPVRPQARPNTGSTSPMTRAPSTSQSFRRSRASEFSRRPKPTTTPTMTGTDSTVLRRVASRARPSPRR